MNTKDTYWSSKIKESVSLINADIEGFEFDMLVAMKERIIKDRPVMAICVYHRNEDLVNIPQFINKTVSNYRFVLRKYPCSVQWNVMRTSELVLYAIPDERSKI